MSEPISALRHLDHVGVAVWDVSAALPYYVEQLGLPLLHRETVPGIQVDMAYLDLGNCQLQLVAPAPGGGAIIRDFLLSSGEGLHHVCFAVDRIESALDALVATGALPATGAPIFLGGRGHRACFLPAAPGRPRVELIDDVPLAPR